MKISDKKLQDKIKWYPHSGQEQVLNCKNKEKLIRAGRGWGKSAVCGYTVVKFFLEQLGKIRRGEGDECKIWIVAPTYELAGKVFEYVVKFLLIFDKKFSSYIQNRPIPQIRMAESIWIQCKSVTEPSGLLGERLNLQIVDEAPLIPEKIYFQYLRPSAGKGDVIYIGTPRGEGWFKNKYYILKEQNAAFHYLSSQGVYYDEAMIEKEKEFWPELLFRQEFFAEFVSEAGTVFRNLDDIIVPNICRDAEAGHFYVMGVDLAETEDATAITVMDRDTKKVVHTDWWKQKDYPLQKQQIIAKAQRYNNARIIMDTTGVGKPIYEDLQQAGVFVDDFTFTGKSKEELMGKLIVYIEEKYIRIPNEQRWIDELKAYEYKYRNPKTGLPYKNIKYGPAPGYHDDCVDSLALAVWGLNPGKPIFADPIARELSKVRINKLKSFI